MLGKRWEIKIGAPLEARDGSVGHVQQVVLKPGNKHVMALVVRRGVLFRQDAVIPIEAVEDATDELIRLHLSSNQLQFRSAFQPVHDIPFITAIAGYGLSQAVLSLFGQNGADMWTGQDALGVPGAIIGAGQRVECQEGYAGKVAVMLLEEHTKRVTHFVVRQGILHNRDIMVPVELVSEFHEDHLKLAVDRATLDPLPEYLPDKEIENRIVQALWEDDLIRRAVLTYTPIKIVVQDGVVILRGHVSTSGKRQRVEDIVREVRGVQGLENSLVIDYEVEVAVARALGRDPRTRDHIVKVGSRFGHVFLQGQVPTLEIQMAAEEVAATVPRVRNVINRLRMSRRPAAKTALRIVESRIGQELWYTL
jgi:osmotically-inducible protein OsmY